MLVTDSDSATVNLNFFGCSVLVSVFDEVLVVVTSSGVVAAVGPCDVDCLVWSTASDPLGATGAGAAATAVRPARAM